MQKHLVKPIEPISGMFLNTKLDSSEIEAERGKVKIENKYNGFEEVFAKYRHPKVDTTQNTEDSYIDTIMYLYEQRKKIKCVNE